MNKEPETVGCVDGCGARIEEDRASEWEYLPIQKRYRCWACFHALRTVNERSKSLEGDEKC